MVPGQNPIDLGLGAALGRVPFEVEIELALELLVLLYLQDASPADGALPAIKDPRAAVGAETMFAGVQPHRR